MAAATIAEIERTLDRLAQSMVESDKRRAEADRALAEYRAESDRRRAEADRALAEYRAESDRRREATERVLAESRAETERVIRKMSEKVDRIAGNVGGLNRSIGEIIQIIVIPGVISQMNALGHDFTMASIEKEYYKIDNRRLLEVDLLLENCQEVMAIEVKTSVTENKVEHHLSRLNLLRKNESKAGLTGKTMYAAIGGLHFTDDARQLATESGMYLIDIDEDNEKINVIPPEKARTW